MRTIAVVTVGRSDYGIYRPVLARIQAHPDLTLHLIVAGMHLSPRFGDTVREIEADGMPIGDRVDMLLSSDTPEGVAMSMGLGTIGFAQAYARTRPDLLVVIGDRAEMHAAAVAAVPFGIPIAHVHGGEITEGAIDDALRHSITKLSHLHFVSTDEYAQRVRQMGEQEWRVHVSGAPSLDSLATVPRLTLDELGHHFGFGSDRTPLLVTFHPVTLEPGQAEQQVTALLEAIATFDLPVVFTMPNADVGGGLIADRLSAYVRKAPAAWLVPSLGTVGYFSLMACAAAMVGNSSSGLVEAPSFGLPVVNIGARQQGRVRAANVIDVAAERNDIRRGITRALQPEFRASLVGMVNPYGSGHAADVIVNTLAQVPLDAGLVMKHFADLKGGAS